MTGTESGLFRHQSDPVKKNHLIAYSGESKHIVCKFEVVQTQVPFHSCASIALSMS